MLQAIFDRQQEFKNRLQPNLQEYHASLIQKIKEGRAHELYDNDKLEVLNWIQQHADACMMESAELKDWTPWKHWSKKTGNKEFGPEDFLSVTHINEMRFEVVDQLCFLINEAIWLGMTPETLDRLHHDKVSINHSRQDEGDY